MPRRVDPEAYRRETPIFARMLAEREGRFPGTPEGEEDFPEFLRTQEVTEDVQDAQDAQAPAQGLLARIVPVSAMAIQPVVLPSPVVDPEETQAMPVPLFVEPDDEG